MILQWKWRRSANDVKDNAYETPLLIYNRDMDQLMLTINITISKVEKWQLPTMPRRRNDGFRNVDDELGRHHANGYTTHHNGFQQSERPTNGIRFNSIYSKQNLYSLRLLSLHFILKLNICIWFHFHGFFSHGICY